MKQNLSQGGLRRRTFVYVSDGKGREKNRISSGKELSFLGAKDGGILNVEVSR
jgi:hypothetical protein